MGTYLLRRTLLMIPTLIGITFIVFMLIALSPGGIGAGLRFSSGGSMDQTTAAVRQAYLDDRFGLDDPALVQYVRWLERVSPVKFGPRDQIAPDGERITPPKAVKPPPLWQWFTPTPQLPAPEPQTYQWPVAEWDERGMDDAARNERRAIIFRNVTSEYAGARSAFIAAKARFEQAASIYARNEPVNRPDAVTRDGHIRPAALLGDGPDTSSPHWPEVDSTGRAMMDAYAAALTAREKKIAVFNARPYPQAGVPLIPGRVSLGPPDLGVSFSRNRPVTALIATHLPVTIMLNLIAFPIIYLVAVPSGMLAAIYRGRWIDVVSGALYVALWSFPIVLAGVLAIGYLSSKNYLGWFPASGLHSAAADSMAFLPSRQPDGSWSAGFLVDTLWHMCLPIACIVYTGFAVLSKQTRAAMLDNFNADYVRTAKAKGVSSKDILLRHVFRNSLLPLITIFVTIFPAMLAGSVIIEKIFTVPGMGTLIIDAITQRDRELLLANTLIISSVNLLALLLADVLYAFADPRISYR